MGEKPFGPRRKTDKRHPFPARAGLPTPAQRRWGNSGGVRSLFLACGQRGASLFIGTPWTFGWVARRGAWAPTSALFPFGTTETPEFWPARWPFPVSERHRVGQPHGRKRFPRLLSSVGGGKPFKRKKPAWLTPGVAWNLLGRRLLPARPKPSTCGLFWVRMGLAGRLGPHGMHRCPFAQQFGRQLTAPGPDGFLALRGPPSILPTAQRSIPLQQPGFSPFPGGQHRRHEHD
ncbi:MAG: hypothetical protein CM15mP128_2960 [Methanobacteriota archaeon]|nr:MAG: hypothetical protein CM15mP128_2960 [Euryarchaeota archaeon]